MKKIIKNIIHKIFFKIFWDNLYSEYYLQFISLDKDIINKKVPNYTIRIILYYYCYYMFYLQLFLDITPSYNT